MNKATVTSNNEKKRDMNNGNFAYLNGFVNQYFHN